MQFEYMLSSPQIATDAVGYVRMVISDSIDFGSAVITGNWGYAFGGVPPTLGGGLVSSGGSTLRASLSSTGIRGSALAGASTSSGLVVGRNLGRLGTIAPTQGGRISFVTGYAQPRMVQRGLSLSTVQQTVANPSLVISQGNRSVYLTSRALVVVDREGRVVTAYSRADFNEAIRKLLKELEEAAKKKKI